ncbi:MAG: transporter substrate-binding domain-containing protein [Burkholderiales bacterium]|nr:transporter substrate-binding domain-containing protein [Burkholderiales bacterium]
MQVSGRRIGSWAFALAFGCTLLQAVAAQAQSLTLHYQERPPYSYTQPDGAVAGLVAAPAAQALAQAQLPFAWARTPSQRQLALIQEGEGLHCGIGWFRNAERASRGKFSKALYRDRPFEALARADSPLRPGLTAAQAMALAGDSLLVKEGYSYGAQFDRLILLQQPAPLSTSVEPAQMLRMLLAGRAGWMIVAPEEARQLRQEAGPAAAGLRAVALADMAQGETRHLYCNRAVPDVWVQRIDQALVALAR